MLFQAFFSGLRSFVAVFCSRALFGYGCASLALRTTAEDTFMASQFFWPCSTALTDILDSANLPPFLDVSTPTVAVRALARVSAQLSTSARGRGSLARRGLGSAPTGHSDGWAASGVKLRARGRSRGSREGILLHQVARRLLIRLADSQLKIFRRRINGE